MSRGSFRRWVGSPLALRALVTLVLGIFVHTSTLAWATPCGGHDERPAQGEAGLDDCCPHARNAAADAPIEVGSGPVAECDGGSGDDDGAPCSCPVPCSSSCSGLPAPVLPEAPILAGLYHPDVSELAPTLDPTRAVSIEPHDILHVPKRA